MDEREKKKSSLVAGPAEAESEFSQSTDDDNDEFEREFCKNATAATIAAADV